MDKKQFTDEARQLSALDYLASVRPDSDDLEQPEFAALRAELSADADLQRALDRLHGFDHEVVAALDDVDVPAGLADRLLARLAEQNVAAGAAQEAAVELAPAAERGSGARGRFTRRQAGWAIGVAASLLIATFAVWQAIKPATFAIEEIPSLASTWRSELSNGWHEGALPAGFVVPGPLRKFMGDWQAMLIKGHDAIAVRLRHPGGREAMLFVVRGGAGRVEETRIPSSPQSPSGGWAVGYWRDDNNLNVLLVQGGVAEYQKLIKSDAGALALREPPPCAASRTAA
jgi:hypothetical protein